MVQKFLHLMLTRKSVGKKYILLLITMHDNVPVTKDERCKPGSLILYDHKRRVDVVYGYVSPNNLQSQFMDKMQRVLKVSELR